LVVENDLGVEADQRMEGDPFRNVAGFIADNQADGGFHGVALLSRLRGA
jgi:hypothetical protein